MRNENKNKYTSLCIVGCIIVAFAVFMYLFFIRGGGITGMIKAFLSATTSFVFGAVIAYLLTPLCRRLEHFFQNRSHLKKYSSVLSITLTMLFLILLIAFVVLILIPSLVNSIANLASSLPEKLEELSKAIQGIIDKFTADYPAFQERFHEFNQKTTEVLKELLPKVLRSLISVTSGLVNFVVNFFLGMIVSVYLLADRKRLAMQARLLLRSIFRPSWADWIEKEVHFTDRVFIGFFVGKIIDSALVGILVFIGCLILGIPSPVLIAVIMGITNMIPFFGQFLGTIPCAFLVFLYSPIKCVIFVIFAVILLQIDGNVISPIILGDTTGLSGLWVMFAIFLFGGLWGIIGMIIGVPLFAVIYDILRQLTRKGLHKRNQEALLTEYNQIYHPDEKTIEEKDTEEKNTEEKNTEKKNTEEKNTEEKE